MLIKKGFAWAIVDEAGKLIEENRYYIYPTKKQARYCCEPLESVVKVRIEVIKKGKGK